ncbi:hypothetical protein, partial [uncultured Clostridium sp.]|uniref:hypothetical protein n=1 Tax=uncultured Clostridium sp. TaxID=59620 RepID=UPI0026110071
ETKPTTKPEVKPAPVVKPAVPTTKPAVKPVEQPKGTITVLMKNTQGQLIGQIESATGVIGSKDTLKMPTIPNGYKEKSMKVNGVSVNEMPTTFKEGTQDVVIIVAAETEPVKVVFESNGQVITIQTKDMTVGSKLTDSLIPSALSQHYVIKSVTVDGQSTGTNVSGTVHEGQNVVIVNIARK